MLFICAVSRASERRAGLLLDEAARAARGRVRGRDSIPSLTEPHEATEPYRATGAARAASSSGNPATGRTEPRRGLVARLVPALVDVAALVAVAAMGKTEPRPRAGLDA